jgi:hypothetical protein
MNYGRFGRELLLELKRGDDRSLDVSTVSGDRGDKVAPSAAPLLAPYNDELVMNCIQDVRLHVNDLRDQAAAAYQMSSQQSEGNNDKAKVNVSMNVRPNIVLQSASVDRNKRCLLAYHVGRIQRIKPYYWNTMMPNASSATTTLLIGNDDGDANNNDEDPDDDGHSQTKQRSATNTCPAEDEFLREYGRLVQQYTQAVGLRPDDLRAHGMAPPAPSDKVQVRVVACPPLGAANSSKEMAGNDDGEDDDENTIPSNRGGRAIVLDSGTSVVFTRGSTHYLLWDDVEEFVRLGYLQVLEGEEQQG